ncbi:hypothetical protein [Pseudomarimonas salicorniae]|uniref:SPFH domain / Band 7 family protein n=1 Tax=Pseudomarimonas salicorniae TaxID=2933270 RepID=A0ABT0GGD2_9GAMM|nr:hypothetical protein [Lysobacter sp. CAU 1642]MCK7593598.1 hypothetical protein [Lysobacter sp. CAU 1642]
MDVSAAAVSLALILVLPLLAMRNVPTDRVVPVRRWGRFHRALGPGWHVVWPILDRAGPGVPLIGHRVTAADAADGQARAEVFFQILDPQLIGRDLERVDAIVSQAAVAQLTSLGAGIDAATWAPEFKARLNRALQGLGLRVTRCQLR